MINQKFNRLTVAEFSGMNKHGSKMWLCECECGKSNIVSTTGLRRGHTKSCGCLVFESSRKQAMKLPRLTHGMSKNNRFYRIWSNVKTRCLNPADKKNFGRYGGSGITVDQEWLIFENFKKDMHESYLAHSLLYGEQRTTLDRIDNLKGYTKTNCRWATQKKQANNRKNVPFYKYKDEELTISQLAEKYNIKYETLVYRIRVAKWTIEEAIERPIK